MARNPEQEHRNFKAPESKEERQEYLNEVHAKIQPLFLEMQAKGYISKEVNYEAVETLAGLSDKDLEDLSRLFARMPSEDRELGSSISFSSEAAEDQSSLQKMFFVTLAIVRQKAQEFMSDHPVDKTELSKDVQGYNVLLNAVSKYKKISEVPRETLITIFSLSEEKLREIAKYQSFKTESVADTQAEMLPQASPADPLQAQERTKTSFDNEKFMEIYSRYYKVWSKVKRHFNARTPKEKMD